MERSHGGRDGCTWEKQNMGLGGTTSGKEVSGM